MESKTAKGCGAAIVRWLGSYVLTLLIFACIVLVAVPVLLGGGTYLTDHFDSNTAFLLTMGLGLMVLFAIVAPVLAYAIWVLLRRRSQLDAVFMPLGLAGSGLNLSGRQYHGAFQGRRVDVYYIPDTGGLRAFGPPTKLDLYLATPLKTSLAVVTRDAVTEAAARLTKQPELRPADADWANRDIYALDSAWSGALLADPAAKTAILRLTTDQGALELRQFILRPEALHLSLLRFPQSVLTPQIAQGWLDDLLLTARVAESLPPPTQTEQASGLERVVRTDRNRVTLITWGILLALGLVAVACVAGFSVLAWVIASSAQ